MSAPTNVTTHSFTGCQAQAVALAERTGRSELLPELRDRLARYQAGQKYRER